MTLDRAQLDAWLSAARASHRRVAEIVAACSDEELSAPSYDDEWTIAQVLSHLGSGAEIFSMILAAGVEGRDAPGVEEFQPVWQRWNDKSAPDQAHDAIVADAAFLDQIDALDDQQRADWRIAMFGGDQDLVGLLRFRLGEHALHTWDVAVAGDPSAVVAPDAVELLIDTLEMLVGHAGKPTEQPVRVRVSTEGPTREFLLQTSGDGITLTLLSGDDPDDAATLRLSSEALLRLIYGRLDPEHTPALDAAGVDLDVLRRAFPGF